MLQKGFLQKLSDYVSARMDAHPGALDEAAKEFQLQRWLDTGVVQEDLLGLFSEWLVFDRTSSVFAGMTGLDYFLTNNPLRLSKEELSGYHDIAKFQVGFFEIVRVIPGERVVCADLDGVHYDVFDINTSLSATVGQTMWTRIAAVAGTYHMVGSVGFAIQVTFGPGLKRAAKTWDTIDAKVAAQWKYGNLQSEPSESIAIPQLPLTQVTQELEEALRAVGMHHMFGPETIKRWTDGRRFPPGFPIKATFYLLPENFTKPQRERVMTAVSNYANALPRSSNRGQSAAERWSKLPPEQASFQTDILSYDKYTDFYEAAHAHMKVGDAAAALDAFTKIVQQYLQDKVPIFPAFRVYINAALACFMHPTAAKDGLGFALVDAALRLNPEYDYGHTIYAEYVEPFWDISDIPKKDRKLAQSFREIIAKDGERRYRRSVFHRYEKFVTEKCDVSLQYKTHTTPTVYRIGEEEEKTETTKIGRNEPCPCGSGKKYKKCCL